MADRRGVEAGVDEHAETESLVEAAAGAGPRSRTMIALSGIERFTLLKRLGQGGMGTVYAAYDNVLDRKVAVKLVRADRRATTDPVTPRDQLLREAQAMARLAHPHVVAVHEVGEVADDIYMVIELVDGVTLGEWLKERPRTWREIVAAFLQAGAGLAAAHDAGLVHRDFKPNNVLVRRDGRVQVTDFGVVSMGGSTDQGSSDGPTTSVGDITFSGRRVGTPAYMALEQYEMATVDARADQFSFSVALWDALYQERPFAGKAGAQFEAIRANRIVAPSAKTRVPGFIEAALRRGLSAKADDRWPTMQDLLDELARDPERARRRTIGVAAGTAGAVGLAITAWIAWPRPAEPCAGAEAHLIGRWDANRAAAITTAFAASHASFAPVAAIHVVAQLDGWASRWVAARVATCRATRVVGEQSEALLDARMHCLDRQLDEVTQLATALVTSDRAAIARAAEELALPDVAACADRDVVMARVAPPGTALTRERVAQIEHELARIRAVERLGRYHDARPQADTVAARAIEVGFAPLTAEALLVRGQLEEQDGDLAAARATLAESARVAATARDDQIVARSLVTLIGVLVDSAEVPGALALGIAASAATARAGDDALEAELVEQLGAARAAVGDAEGEAYLQRALRLREASSGGGSIAVAQVLNKLAGVWTKSGRAIAAREAYERALKIVTERLGTQHPATAIARANVCYLDATAGKLEEARTCQEDVLVTLENALGHEHPQVAWALNEVALVQREQGDVAGAERRFASALAIWETTSGPTHPDVAWPLINLGEIANTRGDDRRAEALCRRALDVLEPAKSSGPKASSVDAGAALACLGEALSIRAPRDAMPILARALELAKVAGEDTTALAASLARAQAAANNRR